MIDRISVRKLSDSGRLKAVATIVIDGVIAIHDIKILEDIDNGYFLAMPSKRLKEKFVDIAHPISKEARAILENIIFRCVEDLYNEEESHISYQCIKTDIHYLEQKYEDFQRVE